MKLWQKILIGMLLGVAVGVIFGQSAAMLKPLGTLFINLIKMIVVPLIFFSIISGVTSLNDPKTMGRVGLKAVSLYFATTIFAVSIGLAIGTALKPGAGTKIEFNGAQQDVETPSAIDRIINIIPDNPIASLAGGDVLQVIFFAIFLGIAMVLTGDKATPIIKLNEVMANVMYKMTEIIMKFAPYGVFGLMAWLTAEQGLEALTPLIKLMAVMVIAYLFHMVVVYGSAIYYIGGLSPIMFFRKIFEAQLVALTTSSSSATLPVTMRVVSERLGASRGTTSFVLPLGTTVNMDGSAIYQGVCALFVAQAIGVDLDMNAYMTIVLTATLVSIGAAGIPSGGFAMLAIVLSSVNLPLDAIALIAVVERLLDMGRTVVNVTGDAAVAILVDKSEGTLNKKIYNNEEI